MEQGGRLGATRRPDERACRRPAYLARPVRYSVGVLGRLKTVSGRLSELVERELPELVAAPAGGGKVGTLPAGVAAAGGSNGAGHLEQRRGSGGAAAGDCGYPSRYLASV